MAAALGTDVGRHRAGFPVAMGPGGDLVTGTPRARWIFTAAGRRVRMPKTFVIDDEDTELAVTASGSPAFTSIRDHPVHVFACR